jgi:hypothetical protein
MTVEAGTIPGGDVPTDNGFDSTEGAVDAFLANLTGEPVAPPKKDAEAPTESPTETGEPVEENTEGEPDADPNDPDEQEVEVKVGEETKKPKLKELKRLYGQEAALTQRSQKVAETLKLAEARETQAGAALQNLLAKAEEKAKPYRDIDWLVLSQRMETADFEALRQDAALAEGDVKFLKEELGKHVQGQQERAQTAYREAAATCLKTLQDPDKGIKGWNKELYDGISKWAAEQGAPAVRDLVDPAAWKIVHMAYQYAQQQSAARTAETKAQVVRNKPNTVIAPKGTTRASADRKTTAIGNLRRTGSIDDAVNAFMPVRRDSD